MTAGGAKGVTLLLEPTYRASTLSGRPTLARYRSWDADPASAERVGRVQTSTGGALANALFASALTFTRASAATGFDSTGSMIALGVNAIRMGYDPATLAPAGILVEQASSNSVRNPRAEGGTTGVIGSGGAWPTNWSILYGSAGLSIQIVGTGTEAGIPYVDVRYFGTATSDGFPAILPDTMLGIAAATGQTWSSSVYLRVSAGSLANITGVYPGWQWQDNLGNQTGFKQNFTTPTTAGLATQRYTATDITTNAATTNAVPFITTTFVNGAVIDVTFRVGGFSLEQAAAVTSLMLPAVATPAVSTRSIDSLTVAGAAFTSTFGTNPQAGFVIVDAMLPQLAPTLNTFLFELSDGTSNQRLGMFQPTGASDIRGSVANLSASVNTNTSTIGTVVAGTAFRAGLRWSNGTLSVCLNAGSVVSLTPTALATGLTTLNIGNRSTGLGPMNGRIRGLWAGSSSTAAKFQAACAPGADVDAVMRA